MSEEADALMRILDRIEAKATRRTKRIRAHGPLRRPYGRVVRLRGLHREGRSVFAGMWRRNPTPFSRLASGGTAMTTVHSYVIPNEMLVGAVDLQDVDFTLFRFEP
jgi:hypothetical protein